MGWLIENAFYVFTVAFVVGIALLGSFLAMQSQSRGGGFFSSRPRRLGVVEQTSVDGRRKLLLVRRDNVEHLVLIGGPIDVILETGIARPLGRTEALELRETPPPLYTNGHAEATLAPEISPSLMRPDVADAGERDKSVTAFPFRGAARRLFSKMSLPAINQPAMEESSQAVREADTSIMVELGDERQAEKVT